MTPRELIVLSPYRFPAQNPLMLGNEDVASLLNAYLALWHPMALRGASQIPRLSSPYDHEQPQTGQMFALPASPPLLLPDDWDARVKAAGAIAFRATADRDETLDNLREALRQAAAGNVNASDLDLPPERWLPFLGIGFGLCMVETLFEAMEHEKVLAVGDFWTDVQQAVASLHDADPSAIRSHLQSAADRLLAAREVLYPVAIHLLDLGLVSRPEPLNWPASFSRGLPVNLIAATDLLQTIATSSPDAWTTLRERVQAEQAEICGGAFVERADALLPLESQLWNLRRGTEIGRELLGQEIRVYGRQRSAGHRQLPLLLNQVGLRRAILLAFDDAVVPTYRVTVINWPSPDGRQVEAFTRPPYAAENPQTFFHLAHYLHKTIAQDHAATLALLHKNGPPAPGYEEWLELSRLAPVLGSWTTLSRYFNEVLAGEYVSAISADEFHGDALSERTDAHDAHPVSGFAEHLRLRRRLDAAWTMAALHRGLLGRQDLLRLNERFRAIEERLELGEESVAPALEAIEQEAGGALASRLLSRATGSQSGYLVLNACSFTRRVALEWETTHAPLHPGGPLKACQVENGHARLVVEVPALGFAWIPQSTPGAAPAPSRMRLADNNHVRNEFFEAEIDLETGGLRALRDPRTRINRLGQQLVFNPGSIMRAKEVRMTSCGPALGEVVAEGNILDEYDKVLARFRQRFRAWLGRPILEMRIELFPEHAPQGYPWHAYYGARFAWRDERAALLRGVAGMGALTSHTRPETPDYLEIRSARESTTIFPGGLPFHQRHGGRMLDVILLPEGEKATAFELGLGLDREYPMQTALGMATPVTIVPTSKGPPHVGAAGWLFHLDAPNLLLTSLRPAADDDAIVARMLETHSHGGTALWRCVRNPTQARLQDARGESLLEAGIEGDAVRLEYAGGDLIQVRVAFS